MKQYTVAVVGATGLVGRKMLEVLQERNFPVKDLRLLASARSVGVSLPFGDASVIVEELTAECFRGVDVALFSAGGAVSKETAPQAVAAGAVVVDNSSAWRMAPEVPLVVPEVNPQALKEHRGIIANPNCSTIQMVVALHPLHRRYQIKRVVAATYQAVSGSGKTAVEQLRAEIAGSAVPQPAYPHPIAYNCLPQVDVFLEDGYTREEHKMIRETRKIMAAPQLAITATCVRTPVITGHSEALNVEFCRPFDLEEVREILRRSPGIILEDDPGRSRYPMPINAAGRDEVFVGRLRRDPSIENGLDMWVVSDNLRKGAATNTVQIAEKMIEMGLL